MAVPTIPKTSLLPVSKVRIMLRIVSQPYSVRSQERKTDSGREDAFAIYDSRGYTGAWSDTVLFAYDWGQYAGFLLFGIGIWRSGWLPQGAVILGIAFAVLTPVAWAVSSGLGFLGPLLIVIAEVWVAWAAWVQLSPTKARPQARPRVR
jgi:hypothetical protein